MVLDYFIKYIIFRSNKLHLVEMLIAVDGEALRVIVRRFIYALK